MEQTGSCAVHSEGIQTPFTFVMLLPVATIIQMHFSSVPVNDNE